MSLFAAAENECIIIVTAGLNIYCFCWSFSRRLSAQCHHRLFDSGTNVPTRLPQLPSEMGQISQSIGTDDY